MTPNRCRLLNITCVTVWACGLVLNGLHHLWCAAGQCYFMSKACACKFCGCAGVDKYNLLRFAWASCEQLGLQVNRGNIPQIVKVMHTCTRPTQMSIYPEQPWLRRSSTHPCFTNISLVCVVLGSLLSTIYIQHNATDHIPSTVRFKVYMIVEFPSSNEIAIIPTEWMVGKNCAL